MLVTNLDNEERSKFDRELNTGVSDDEIMNRLQRRATELLKAEQEPSADELAAKVDAEWLDRHTALATPEPESEPKRWVRREIRWHHNGDGEGG
jgi:hypothetical protein